MREAVREILSPADAEREFPKASTTESEQRQHQRCRSLLPKVAGRWATVVIFAMAMAWVESAVVYYLRTMINRIEPYQPNPLPIIGGLGPAEMVREAATLIMLLTVGILAGRNWRSRLGYAALAFGVWDIFYYVFLKVMCNWPRSLFDWDILFLLPLPWWGPVLAPVSIATLMILWGTLVSSWPIERARDEWKAWALNFLGVAVALYLFMADSIRAANGGVNALRNVLPQSFNWPLFSVALLLMAAPVLQVIRILMEQADRGRERGGGRGRRGELGPVELLIDEGN
jgi:hypothetical protein